MSRHTLANRASDPNPYTIAIGWDRPLQTFFITVTLPGNPEPGDEDDETEPVTVLWKGTAPGEIDSAAAAIEIARAYAVIPDDLEERLKADRADGSSQRDGPAQAAMKRLLFGDGT